MNYRHYAGFNRKLLNLVLRALGNPHLSKEDIANLLSAEPIVFPGATICLTGSSLKIAKPTKLMIYGYAHINMGHTGRSCYTLKALR